MAESVQIQKVNNWHEQLVDFELRNPTATLRETAHYFSKSISWICIVRNSDAFREYRRRRLDKHQSMVSASVIDKAEALAHQSLDALNDRLETSAATMSIDALANTAKLALGALGYTGPRNVVAPTQNNFYFSGDRESVEKARERLRQLKAQNTRQDQEVLSPPVVDAEIV